MNRSTWALVVMSVTTSVGCSNGSQTSSTGGLSQTGGSTTAGTVGTSGSSGATTGGSGTTGSSGSTTGGPADAGCGCDAGTFCDPLDTGLCVACRTDQDCSAPTPICQTLPTYLNYGKCVVCCEAEPTCPTGQVCDLSLGATYQTCVADCRYDAGTPPCPPFLGYEPQHCSQATGTCAPGCALDVDCAPGNLHCLVDAGACVECLGPQDCPYSKAGCSVIKTCGACSVTTDCPAGLTCAITGQCVCANSSGCGGNAPVCLSSTASGVPDAGLCGCTANADCAAQDSLCATIPIATGSCLPPCSDGGTDCGQFASPNQYCDMGTGLCGPCSADNQCGNDDGGPHCLPSGTCGCTSSPDCGPTGACSTVSSTCIPACTLDAGGSICASDQVCDPTSRLCVACISDLNCEPDAGSPTPYCLTDIDAGNTCVGCLSPDQCASASPGCNSRTYSCGSCRLSTDCPAAVPICQRTTCVIRCATDADCTTSAAPYCLNDIDAGDTCVACLSPSQCPDSTPGCDSLFYTCGFCSASSDCPTSVPVCQGFMCGPSCLLPDGGTYCASGVCQPSTGQCVPCLQDSDCGADGGTPYCRTDIDAGTSCAQCLASSECGDAGPCNSNFFYCGTCAANSDCPPEAATCVGAPFGACSDGG